MHWAIMLVTCVKLQTATGPISVLSQKNGQTEETGVCECVCTQANLGKYVLFPHEFLSLSVGTGGDHRQNILAVVGYHAHKENQVLQELRHKPEICMKAKITSEIIKYAH